MAKKPFITFCLLAVSTLILTSGSQAPKFSLRIHVEAGNQIREERVVPVGLVAPDEIIRVHKVPVLTEKYLIDAIEAPNGGVILGLNQAGKHSLETVTRTEMGKTLVVILNGRVVYAAEIDMPMSSGRFLIPGGLEETDVIMLKNHLNERNSY